MGTVIHICLWLPVRAIASHLLGRTVRLWQGYGASWITYHRKTARLRDGVLALGGRRAWVEDVRQPKNGATRDVRASRRDISEYLPENPRVQRKSHRHGPALRGLFLIVLLLGLLFQISSDPSLSYRRRLALFTCGCSSHRRGRKHRCPTSCEDHPSGFDMCLPCFILDGI